MSRLRMLAALLTVTIGLASIFAVWLVLDDLTDRVTTAEQGLATSETRSDANAEAAAEAQAQAEALVDQVESFGQVPVVEPDESITTPSNTAPSFSFIQRLIDIGFAARCPGGSCVGPEGPPAPPAVDGEDGSDGVDGETPSTELLLSLIQPLIPAPIPGINAPRITAVGCNSLTSLDLTFTFDDGTVLTASCGPAIEPEPPTDPPVEVLP